MTAKLRQYHDTVTRQNIESLFQTWHAQQPGTGILALVCKQEPDVPVLPQQAAAAAGMSLAGAVVPGLVADACFPRSGILLLDRLYVDIGDQVDYAGTSVGSGKPHGYPQFHNATIMAPAWP